MFPRKVCEKFSTVVNSLHRLCRWILTVPLKSLFSAPGMTLDSRGTASMCMKESCQPIRLILFFKEDKGEIMYVETSLSITLVLEKLAMYPWQLVGMQNAILHFSLFLWPLASHSGGEALSPSQALSGSESHCSRPETSRSLGKPLSLQA